MRFDEVLRTFAGFFEREGVRWAVGGGLAMQAWGAYFRSTVCWTSTMRSTTRIEPIDVPLPTPEEAAALAAARVRNAMTSDEFLLFLEQFAKQHASSRNPDEPWPEPFEL